MAASGWAEESEGYIEEVESRTGWRFGEGYDSEAGSMRLSADPLRILSRPLLFYIVRVSLVRALC